MNIKINIKKSYIVLALIAFSFLGIISFSFTSSSKDPLKQILGSSFLQADFLTESIIPYSGPLSSSLQECLRQTSSSQTGTVYASYDQSFVNYLSRDEILEQITPVFGYAVKNSQINWEFDSLTKEYIFHTAPGDEALWMCYLKHETAFFSDFFLPSSFSFSKDDPILQITFSEGVSMPSSDAISRVKKYVSTTEAQRSGIFMGALHFSTLLNIKELIHPLFTPHSSGIILPLERDFKNKTSTIEILRNPSHPYLYVTVLSTNEITRNKAADSVKELHINFVNDFTSDAYTFKIFGNEIPKDALFQIQIDPASFSPFIYNNKNITPLFPFGTKSLKTLIVDGSSDIFCPAVYNPVCGIASDTSCPADTICPQMMPIPKTYVNDCELQKANAIFISKGACETPICPAPDLAPPPSGCFYQKESDDITSIPGCVLPIYRLYCE